MLAVLIGFAASSCAAAGVPWVSERPASGSFPLVAEGRAAPVVTDGSDAPVVAHAADDLAADLKTVTGVQPDRATSTVHAKRLVLVGTLGRSAAIDGLVARGRLDVARLRGAWESFLITTVKRPMPGVEDALVIVGSDRRGTAYGVYELSQAVGVSPWAWWADVPAQRHASLWVAAGTRRFGPPSVKYRGIFLNDEDWGLHPWAAKTYEPEAGGIGPKTYARVFELLLRLKANTLWPAMHRVSTPFNADPQNARLADRYAIVMGSSHAEPMLRNNVGEWTAPQETYNFATNRSGVEAYWNERVRTNAGYESLWTLGMRGIHDSGVQGATTIPGKVALLTNVIADQRRILAEHINPDVTQIPQVFMPYKEVLDIYRGGLKVPDDVTLIWPDDNFGYIRQFPDAAERIRAGGSGLYYHLSYLGAPLSYLWLSTTPPALVMEELTRLWDMGARRVWIANVGDIKPAETDISLFMEVAWDVGHWRGKSQREFLDDWSGRTFGAALAKPIGDVLDRYYALNYERRPEHLQWFLPGELPRYSTLSDGEIASRLARFGDLKASLDRVRPSVGAGQSDAFFELVDYPVLASADANERYFAAERYAKLIDGAPATARSAAAVAAAADERIQRLTRRFNEDVAGGKWRYIMAEEPADNQWAQFRLTPVRIPAPGLRSPAGPMAIPVYHGPCDSRPAAVEPAAGWERKDGLGRSGATLIATAPDARLNLGMEVPKECEATLVLLPTFPSVGRDGFTLRLSVDGGAAREVRLPRQAEQGSWSKEILDNRIEVALPVGPGRHRIALMTDQAGLAVDGVALRPAPSSVPAH